MYGPGMRGMGGMQGPPGAQQASCTDQFKDWWSRCPIFTRFLFIGACTLYIFSWLPILMYIPYFMQAFAYYIVYYFNIWRLLTGTIVHESIFNLLFGLLIYMGLSAEREKEMGTVRYCVRFFLCTFCISVVFCLLCMIASMISTQYLFLSMRGFWSVWMIELMYECNKNPDQPRMLCCFPCQFKSRYFPFVILCFFSMFTLLLGAPLPLGIVAGMVIGQLNLMGKMEWTKLSDSRVQRWEQGCLFGRLAQKEHFVSLQSARGEDAGFYSQGPSGGQQQQQQSGGFPMPGNVNTVNSVSNPQASNQPSAFQAFGGKGRTLGSDTESNNEARRNAYNKLAEDFDDDPIEDLQQSNQETEKKNEQQNEDLL